LATSLLRPGQQLMGVRYFTARIRNQPASEQRQEDYLSALAACCPDLLVIEGRFQERTSVCFSCGVGRIVYEEKETDVNLALAITRDAVLDHFDTALLISADGDLCPVIRVMKEVAPAKRVIAAFPPRRWSDALRRVADGTLTVGDDKIRNSQLPDKILLDSGLALERPAYWR
jgi:uncharacterized LabA/DUF88 family protein